jgi:hypothetical protein
VGAGAAGEARFLFEAPRRLGSGAVALTAMAAGSPPSRTDLAVALRVGAPAQLVISPSTHKLVVGGGETARVAISAHDAFGNPTAATGVEVTVDGRPVPVSVGAGGMGTLTLDAPAKFDGRDRITVGARLGAIQAAEEIHVTGGTPARLTIDVPNPRLVGDGHVGTEVRVQAVDRNGTPTAVPGLSWDTPDGRVRHVRMPRDGEYVAEYVPDRIRERQRQVVAVMASQQLRADVTLDVTPPPIRLIAAARAGLFYNFGHAAGPAVFVEAVRPVGVRWLPFPFFLGGTVGYLHSEISGTGSSATEPARLEIDQAPVMVLARARIPLPLRFDVSAEIGAGVMLARTRLITSADMVGFDTNGRAYAPAVAAGAEAAFTLKPGRLVFGLRYLRSELGRTSQGDEITGNSAGLIGDIGYRMTF